jgi:hypothetical protein
MNPSSTTGPKPLWHPFVAGAALGVVLLLTFLVTGHGLGATRFTTALSAVVGNTVAPEATQANAYLGPMVEEGKRPMAHWITWQVIGVLLGGLAAALATRSFRFEVDGARRLPPVGRMALALAGGVASGIGARFALGCTSGMGLSGSATLAVAGFVFLGGFFVVGIVVSLLIRRIWQ